MRKIKEIDKANELIPNPKDLDTVIKYAQAQRDWSRIHIEDEGDMLVLRSLNALYNLKGRIERELAMWGNIKREDNWGHLNYSLYDVKLAPGDKLEVQWPNGTIETVELKARDKYTTVSDHGNSYTVKTKTLFIDVMVHGMIVEVPLGINDLVFRFT